MLFTDCKDPANSFALKRKLFHCESHSWLVQLGRVNKIGHLKHHKKNIHATSTDVFPDVSQALNYSLGTLFF